MIGRTSDEHQPTRSDDRAAQILSARIVNTFGFKFINYAKWDSPNDVTRFQIDCRQSAPRWLLTGTAILVAKPRILFKTTLSHIWHRRTRRRWVHLSDGAIFIHVHVKVAC